MFSAVFNIFVLGLLTTVAIANDNNAPGGEIFGPAVVNLRTAGNYAILAKTGVSTVPMSAITGAIGVSPIAANGITGFGLTPESGRGFATSSQVTGKLFAASFNPPTPSNLTTAIGDMEIAYTDAVGRVYPNYTNLGSGAIGSLVLAPGLYNWAGGVNVANDVTLFGGATDTWIFQISGTFTVTAGSRVTLAGGARAKNIVWAVAGAVTTYAGAHLEGVVLAKTSVTLQTGTTVNGRILAQTNVALQKATIVAPS